MKTTQKSAARADKKSRDCSRAELSFDGFGINGPDEYRSRIATFQEGAGKLIAKYGPMFATAPELLAHIKASIDQDEVFGPQEWEDWNTKAKELVAKAEPLSWTRIEAGKEVGQ